MPIPLSWNAMTYHSSRMRGVQKVSNVNWDTGPAHLQKTSDERTGDSTKREAPRGGQHQRTCSGQREGDLARRSD